MCQPIDVFYHRVANCRLVAGPQPFKIDVVNLNVAGPGHKTEWETGLPPLVFHVEAIIGDLLNPFDYTGYERAAGFLKEMWVAAQWDCHFTDGYLCVIRISHAASATLCIIKASQELQKKGGARTWLQVLKSYYVRLGSCLIHAAQTAEQAGRKTKKMNYRRYKEMFTFVKRPFHHFSKKHRGNDRIGVPQMRDFRH